MIVYSPPCAARDVKVLSAGIIRSNSHINAFYFSIAVSNVSKYDAILPENVKRYGAVFVVIEIVEASQALKVWCRCAKKPTVGHADYVKYVVLNLSKYTGNYKRGNIVNTNIIHSKLALLA